MTILNNPIENLTWYRLCSFLTPERTERVGAAEKALPGHDGNVIDLPIRSWLGSEPAQNQIMQMNATLAV